jgi:hypothetical protein
VDPPVAPPAGQEHPPELALQLGLRLEKLHPQLLRCRDQTPSTRRMSPVSLLHDPVGISSPVGYGADGSLKDFLLVSPCHPIPESKALC